MMNQTIYLNGQYVPAEKALLPVADRGFRFGDGVFETIAVYNGRPYQLELHLARLKSGLSAVKIKTDSALHKQIVELIKKNHITEGFVRIAISRGVGSHGYLPADDNTPTVVIEAFTRHPLKMDSATLHLSSLRKIPSACLPMHHKLAQGLSSTLARMEAKEHGCIESLLLTTEGHVAEASSANIFWVKGRIIYTPHLSTGALAGTTRAAIIRLLDYKVEEVTQDLKTLENADEAFLTNTNWGVLPVTAFGDKQWSIGPVTKSLQTKYKEDIAAYVKA